MEKSDQQIYQEFINQLCEWGETGATPVAGNQDISYGLALQRKRLEQCRVKIEYRLNERKKERNSITTAVFSDSRYTNTMIWKAHQKEVNYYREGKKCLSLKDNAVLYTIVTRLNHSDIPASYCCPNCGEISNVSALLEGCPYCNTRFIMSDLFPKVTNFYFLRDYNLGETEANNKVAIWMISGAVIGFLIRLPEVITNVAQGKSLVFMLLSALLSAGVAAVFGYFALAISLFARLLVDCFKQVPRLPGQLRARKQVTDLLKQFDPGFTYEYFFGRVQSFLKILIFKDDWNGLAIYEGPAEEHEFGNIVDAQFEGAIGLNGYRVEGNYRHLDLNVYMTDVYCQEGQLRQKSDMFRIGLCRDISRPVDYGFSIKQVCCKSCGASFDAINERFCPYCKSRYDLKEDDWVITFVKKG